MNSVSRSLKCTLWVAVAAFVVAVAVVGVLAFRWWMLPAPPARRVPVVPVVTPLASRDGFSSGQGIVFHVAGKPESGEVSFDRLFRLAGTFGVEREGTLQEERQAIVEVLVGGRQEIVGVGDSLGESRVLAVQIDHVILRGPQGRGILRLGEFSQDAALRQGSSDLQSVEDGAMGSVSAGRFGKQVSTNMWVFDRAALESYYTELMEAPDRLLTVFDSLKPLRDENEQITGYRLGIEGEAEFFAQVGMAEGDVVRRVNGIPMTNRRRAEYLIRKFAEEKLNAFALDIERGGEKRRLVYSLR